MLRMTRALLFILGVPLFAALLSSCGDDVSIEDEKEIQVALIRHLVVEEGDRLSGGSVSNKVACVDVWTGRDSVSTDPPASVLEVFRDRRPPVRPRSECKYVGAEVILSYLAHIPTGEGAIGYSIDLESLEYEDGRALVEVSYDEASMSAGIWHCELAKAGTGWVVERCPGSAVS